MFGSINVVVESLKVGISIEILSIDELMFHGVLSNLKENNVCLLLINAC